jgi:cytochrome bd-type quinol oxidase subunit 2
MSPIDVDSYYRSLEKKYSEQLSGTTIGAPKPENVYYNIIYWFLIICGLVAVLSLIYGGILYVTAAGEAEKAERAKKTITGAIVGIIIIIASYSAYNYIIGAVK